MADRYWIGGTGNTNDTAHWSTSSGGAGGATLPTSSDNVIWDAFSASVPFYTVTFNATFNCANFSMVGIDTTNLVGNYDFSSHPASSVPQTTGTITYIDGTSDGASSDPGYGGWRCGNSGSWAVEFDQTDNTYPHAIRLETTGTGSYLQVRSNGSSGYYGANGFALLPSTKYKLTYKMRTEYVSGDSTVGAQVVVMETNADGSGYGSSGATSIKTTTDWTYYEIVFTTGPSVAYGHVELRIYGHGGTGTLIMKAWFAEITVMPCITMAGTSAINVYGDLTFGGISQIERTYSGTLTMRATSGTKNITTNELNLRNLYFNGTGGTFQLAGDLYLNGNASTCVIARTAGTFLHNNKTVYIKNCYNANIGNMEGTSTDRFYNLRIDGLATQQTRVSMGDRQGMNIANKLTIKGLPGQAGRLFIHTSKTGSFSGPYTLSAAEVEAEYLDICGFTVTGGANWDLSAIPGGCGNVGGNVGITFTTGVTRTWSNPEGGNWGDSANWDTGVPLPQDNCDMGIAYNTGAVITTNKTVLGKNIDFTGATGNPTFTMSACNNGSNNIICGNLTLIEDMVFSPGTRRMIFLGTDTIYLTTAGKTFYNIGGNQKKIVFNDDVNANYAYWGCSVDTQGHNFNGLGWASDNGQWAGGSNESWELEGSYIKVTGSLNGYFFHNLHCPNVNGTNCTLEVTGTGTGYYAYLAATLATQFKGNIFINTGVNSYINWNWTSNVSYRYNTYVCKELKVKDGTTIKFCEGKTHNISKFRPMGTSTSLVTITSTNNSVNATLTTDKLFNVDYLNVSYITATQINKLYVGKNSTDGGGNVGLLFYNVTNFKFNSINKGLVSHWLLDAVSESKDLSPTGNNGTKTDITYTTDRGGNANNAYSFNGSTSNVEVINTGLTNSVAKSVSCWIKIDSGCSAFGRIFNHNITGSQWVLCLAGQSGDNYRIGGTPDNGSHYGGTSDYALSINTWYHIAITFDGTNYKLYINGVSQTVSTVTGSFGFTDSGKVYIGKRTGYLFKGSISDLYIHNRALTQEEITYQYISNNPNLTLSSLTKGLVGSWALNSSTLTKDKTVNENNGTIGGNPSLTSDEKGHTNKAMYFDGNGDYIGYRDSTSYPPLLPAGLSASSFSVRFRYDGQGDGSDKRGFVLESYLYRNSLFVETNGVLSVIIATTGNGEKFVTTFSPTIGQWYNVTCILTGGYLKVYVDGQFHSEQARSGTTYEVTKLRIGTYRDANNRWWKGAIRNVKFWNRSLSEAEIIKLYNTYE